MKSRYLAALACAAALASPMLAHADAMSSDLNATAPTRFSAPGVYTGAPAFPVTLSMVIAGGGPSDFSTVPLVKALAGDKTDAEVASLQQKFGDAKVTNFVKVFAFVVYDSLASSRRRASRFRLRLTRAQGRQGARRRVMGRRPDARRLQRRSDARSRGIASDPRQVMNDIDTKYGVAADADYHAVLNQAMHDLASVYGLALAFDSGHANPRALAATIAPGARGSRREDRRQRPVDDVRGPAIRAAAQ